MKKVYIAGVYLNEKHIEQAWERIRAGVNVEQAAESVLPGSKRINSTNRTVYLSNLVTVLTLKSHLFTLAYQQRDGGGDWHRIFRGRRRIFWPNAQERRALGLSDYALHEVTLTEPRKGKLMRVRMLIDHGKKSVKDAVVVDLDGHAK